jgi:KDO2-lipid IV(A) lauroyltransferase
MLTEQRDVARTFAQFGACLAESLGWDRVEGQSFQCRVCGEATLRELEKNQSGFVVLTAHVGAWDLAAKHLQKEFHRPVMIAMTREPNQASQEFHDSIRLRRGVEIVHVGDNTFEGLRLLRHLRNGGVIAVQMDRVPAGSRGLSVPLFGQDFRVPLGPFQLAALANAPLVPVFCARTGYFEYEITVNPEVRIGRRPSAEQLCAAASAVSRELERFLRRYPTQWFNFELPQEATQADN